MRSGSPAGVVRLCVYLVRHLRHANLSPDFDRAMPPLPRRRARGETYGQCFRRGALGRRPDLHFQAPGWLEGRHRTDAGQRSSDTGKGSDLDPSLEGQARSRPVERRIPAACANFPGALQASRPDRFDRIARCSEGSRPHPHLGDDPLRHLERRGPRHRLSLVLRRCPKLKQDVTLKCQGASPRHVLC